MVLTLCSYNSGDAARATLVQIHSGTNASSSGFFYSFLSALVGAYDRAKRLIVGVDICVLARLGHRCDDCAANSTAVLGVISHNVPAVNASASIHIMSSKQKKT